MRVPLKITPGTRPTPQVQGYENAPTVDFSGLGDSARRLSNTLQQKKEEADSFSVKKAYTQEINDVQDLYHTRTMEEGAGAPGFASKFESELETRHRDMLSALQKAGYTRRAIEEADLKFSSIRNVMQGPAVKFEDDAQIAKSISDSNVMVTNLSQYARATPEGIESADAQLREGIFSNPYINDNQKQGLYQDGLKILNQAAAEGYTLQHPRDVLNYFAPESQVPTTGNIDLGNGGSFDTASYLAKMKQVESGGKNVKNTLGSSAFGLFQFTNRTWLETFKRANPDTKLSDSEILAQRSDVAVQQKMAENFTAFNIVKLQNAPVEIPINNTSVYLAHWLGAAGAIKLLSSSVDTPISQLVSADVLAKNPALRNAGTVQGVIEYAHKVMDEAKADVEPSGAITTIPGTPTAHTGIPALDRLDGTQQLNLVSLARQEVNRQQASLRATVEVSAESETTAIQNGVEFTGHQLTLEEAKSAYGDVIGAQKFAEVDAWRKAASFIKSIQTMPPDQITAQLEKLKPTNTGAADYVAKQEVYNKMESAAAGVMQKRDADPTAYIFQNYPNIRNMMAAANDSESRRRAYGALANAYKQMGISPDKWLPVPKEQVAAIRSQYDGAGPEQKLQMLEGWWNDLQGSGMYVPFMVQMNGKSNSGPGYDNFTRYMLNGHPQQRDIMLDILQGKDEIRNDPARKPSDADINSAFAGRGSSGARGIGSAINALNPDASRIINENAAAIYVARGGRTDKPDGLDPAAYQEALRIALGGIENNQDSGILQYNDDRPNTILPPGITGTQWNNWIQSRTDGSFTAISEEKTRPISKFGTVMNLEDIIDDGRFIMKAPGKYAIMMPDKGTVRTRSGREFIVNITPATVKR